MQLFQDAVVEDVEMFVAIRKLLVRSNNKPIGKRRNLLVPDGFFSGIYFSFVFWYQENI